jgi:hypothetical protein
MARFLWATVLAIVFAPLYRRPSRSNLAAFTTVVIIMVIVILGGGPLHDASRAMPAMASSPRRACSVFCAMAAICARHDRGSSFALRRCRRGEHEAWFGEGTEVIDFFAAPRDDFLLGGKPACMSEG